MAKNEGQTPLTPERLAEIRGLISMQRRYVGGSHIVTPRDRDVLAALEDMQREIERLSAALALHDEALGWSQSAGDFRAVYLAGERESYRHVAEEVIRERDAALGALQDVVDESFAYGFSSVDGFIGPAIAEARALLNNGSAQAKPANEPAKQE